MSTESPREAPRSFSTSRPVAVLMIAIATVVFGYFSYERLPLTLMPELSYPTLTVRTEYPGAAPEEVENDVSRPIEEALGVIGGLARISSISRSGVSDVVLEFGWNADMTEALQDTLEKLDLVFLPQEAQRPLILRFDPSLDPVLELSLSGHGAAFEGEEGLRRVRRIAELQVRRELERIPGVAAVRVRGGLEEEIHVLVSGAQLRRTGIPIQRLIDRLRQENVNVAGGTLKEGRVEYMVRTLNEFQDLRQIEDVVIASTGGRDVRVRDLAQVVRAHKEREIITRTNGSESVQIDVYKEADANMVSLAREVRSALGDFDRDAYERRVAAGLPEVEKKRRPRFGPQKDEGADASAVGLTEKLYQAEGVLLEVVADRSIFIESAIDEVRSSAVWGGLLAVAVLFLFLRNWKSTAIIAVAIPISLVVTFAPLHLLGVSLNIMSLGGLALGVGMLVDASIVVLESIFRCREEGDGVVEATVRGTREVAAAVVASVLTTIVVFFPMVFVEGVAGQAFGDLGWAVVMSLLASMVVALSFVPMLASRRGLDLGAPPGDEEDPRPPLTALARRRADGRALRDWWRARPALRALPALLFGLYLVLSLALQLPLELLGRFLLALLRGGLRFGALAGRRVLGPLVGLATLPFLKLAGLTLEGLQNGYPRVMRFVLGRPRTMIALTLVFFAATFWLGARLETELLPEVHQGEVTVETALPVGTPLEQTDAVLRPVEEAILAEREHIRALLVTIGYDAANAQRADEGEHTARFKVLLKSSDPVIEEEVVEQLRRRFAEIPDLKARVVWPVLFSFKTPIEVEIHGDDLAQLRLWAERVRSRLAALPELADVETTLQAGAPEVQILYDRDRLARYGLNVATVAEQVRNSVQGYEATRFNLEDRRIPILVRFEQADREIVGDVRELVINPGGERPIPLSAVAEVVLGEGPSEVRRIDGQRVALVRANLGQGSLGAAVERIEAELGQGLEWPAALSWYVTGQNLEWERSRGSLLLALWLSMFLVYAIMAAEFESLLQPLVIMLTIPLAFLGAFAVLALMGMSLSIMVFLGMILLAGIVVDNAIVLVDYVNTLRARGLGLEDALVSAGTVRLRPILMTTATTVLGLVPMALGLGDGAEIRTPMAVTVIAGMVSSTVLTLVIIPSIYALAERLRTRLLSARAIGG